MVVVQDIRTTMDERNEATSAALSELWQRDSPASPAALPGPLLAQVITGPVVPAPPKLHLPLVDGSNPLDWLFQAAQFFDLYEIVEEQRLRRVACYMTGDALGWYQRMHPNRLISTWVGFRPKLELRFGPSFYESHRHALFKLRQEGPFANFLLKFERLCNRVVGLSPEATLDYFLFGLRPEIQRELVVLHPTSISQAISLARLIDSKLNDKPFLAPPPPKCCARPCASSATL
ncbi:hypothetical protein Salat_2708700 [Sesamum alatum]|uniref:Retrotransposon gag domain-containing protein n=1 Tax=Sesamum alatum TaxID=300844 RepID=A0AAE2CBF1_9LAMI|nr:hypothetical protein Salat_2708700 [Sesamum alatum]